MLDSGSAVLIPECDPLEGSKRRTLSVDATSRAIASFLAGLRSSMTRRA